MSSQFRLISDNSTYGPAQYFAAICIKSIFSNNWNKFDLAIKIDYKEYFVSYLTNKTSAGASLDSLKAVIQCLVLISKICWFEDPSFRKVVGQLQSISVMSSNHQMITFIAFDQLIQEINYYFNRGNSVYIYRENIRTK